MECRVLIWRARKSDWASRPEPDCGVTGSYSDEKPLKEFKLESDIRRILL